MSKQKTLEQSTFEPTLEHETKYLNFYHYDMSKSGKTKIFIVTTKDNYLLGDIRFYGRWRGYQYFPNTKTETVLSIGCMNDIIDFIKSLKKKPTDINNGDAE